MTFFEFLGFGCMAASLTGVLILVYLLTILKDLAKEIGEIP